MLENLSLEEFLRMAQNSKRIAVHQSIYADRLTFIGIAEHLVEELKDGVILESGIQDGKEGRYSFLCFGTEAQLKVCDQTTTIFKNQQTYTTTNAPLNDLRLVRDTLVCASSAHDVNFIHGGIGFLTYDAIRMFESIPNRHEPSEIPEILFRFYTTTVLFDHQEQTLFISTIVNVEGDIEEKYYEACAYLSTYIAKITTPLQLSSDNQTIKTEYYREHLDIDDEQFMALVMRAKSYIMNGDVFQIVLSRCFQKSYSASPFEIYRALRRVSPAPYMFYFPTEYGVILGASPEKLISVQKGKLEMHPIAGTRQRNADTNDAEKTSELLNDKKECAEHMMLVDLARNDLGVVCKPGSVSVDKLLHVKHFSHVSHITSVVTGILRPDKDALDALVAAFPAGTVSGAPKIRAMQLIDELETSKRGLYGGALCRLDFQGNLEACLAIRMAFLQEGTASIRTGAGIVFDSDPQAEAQETRDKARGLLAALDLAERVYDSTNR